MGGRGKILFIDDPPRWPVAHRNLPTGGGRNEVTDRVDTDPNSQRIVSRKEEVKKMGGI